MTYWLADEARASEARYNNDDRAHKRLVVPGYNTRSKRINRGTSHFSNLTEPHSSITIKSIVSHLFLFNLALSQRQRDDPNSKLLKPKR